MVGGSSFHGHPMLRSGAARNLGPMNHFPRAWDTQTSRDLAPEKSANLLTTGHVMHSLLLLDSILYLSIWLLQKNIMNAWQVLMLIET